jgi:hypothetical protein
MQKNTSKPNQPVAKKMPDQSSTRAAAEKVNLVVGVPEMVNKPPGVNASPASMPTVKTVIVSTK